MMFTYQTRLELSDEQRKILEEYARLMSSVERFLFAQSAKGNSIILCKNPSLITFGLTARQFNACRIGLEGKIKACQASQQHAVNQLKEQIASLDEQIKNFEKQPSKRHMCTRKKDAGIVYRNALMPFKRILSKNASDSVLEAKNSLTLSSISKKMALPPTKNGNKLGKQTETVNSLP